VYVLDGGISAWQQADLPLAKGRWPRRSATGPRRARHAGTMAKGSWWSSASGLAATGSRRWRPCH